MIIFYFPSVFLMTYCFLFPLSYTFDKYRVSNTYVRLIHSTGCVLKLASILYHNNFTIMDPTQKMIMNDNVKYVLDRSIHFFLWDCIALFIANEDDKLTYVSHHLISALALWFTRYFEYDWYLICFSLFLAEITNPLTQISEMYVVLEKENIYFEKFYLYCMFLVRGLITPSLGIFYSYQIYKNYQYLRNMYLCSVLINYSIMNILFIGSVNWIHKKYLVLYKNNNDKKMS